MACMEAALLISLVWAFEAALPHKARPFLNILVRTTCQSLGVSLCGETH